MKMLTPPDLIPVLESLLARRKLFKDRGTELTCFSLRPRHTEMAISNLRVTGIPGVAAATSPSNDPISDRELQPRIMPHKLTVVFTTRLTPDLTPCNPSQCCSSLIPN